MGAVVRLLARRNTSGGSKGRGLLNVFHFGGRVEELKCRCMYGGNRKILRRIV